MGIIEDMKKQYWTLLGDVRRLRRRLSRPTFPVTPGELAESNLFTSWWYYSVELLPGLITKGQYPDDFPMLPRILLRNCDLRETSCLDLGSMEGLIPVLMCRQGAKTVVATDAIDHCHDKMVAVRHYYQAAFEFRPVGLMYDLANKLRQSKPVAFDVINLSGLLYHVFSPLMVLAGVRPLLKRNGLMIVSTNVVVDDSIGMEFNSGGRLQEETNTFWYISVRALDYILRYFKLAPIDCLYLPHRSIRSSVRYQTDVESAYCSIVCRAQDDVLPTRDDAWMQKSAQHSWEYKGLIDWDLCRRQPVTQVAYSASIQADLLRQDIEALDLMKAIAAKSIDQAERSTDAHILRLADVS